MLGLIEALRNGLIEEPPAKLLPGTRLEMAELGIQLRPFQPDLLIIDWRNNYRGLITAAFLWLVAKKLIC
jgi:hypothetical protein